MNRRELSERVTVSVEQAGQVLGLSRGAAYNAARRGDIPTLKIGKRLIVSTAQLLAMLDACAEPVAH
ncbi:DNA-binding protein [Cryobacterium sp. TMT1-2-2]|uniref:helix-turn-helix domain-containing protein n=1 Tax=Cryobacterium sp. TMT1-2-2 TaxID=1259233 RepID=UPI001069C434|nr:helix-turn-helix domain-containing protein [Cryobacterium sp. TMT1-2-2]TFD13853.1 DNA-binding protein [Cryobacterium sp. TMT1-2-2]